MPPRGNKGGRRPGVGKRRRNVAAAAVVSTADDEGGRSGENDDRTAAVVHRFDAAAGVTIGQENTRKWALLKESLGYVNDDDFAAFLLHLAEQQQPMQSTSTSSDSKPSTDNSNNDNNDNGGTEPNGVGNGQTNLNNSSGDRKEEEPKQQQQQQQQQQQRQQEQNENESQKEEMEGQETKLRTEEDRPEDDNESLSEDDKDIDWTPSGFRELRCTRQSTRAATLKSRQGVRKTRSHLEVGQLTTKKAKRKRSAALTAARKIPVTSTSIESFVSVLNVDSATKLPSVDKVRLCIDCSQKHLHGECPLVRPFTIVVDSSVSSVIDDEDDIRRPLSQLTLPKILKLVTTDKIHGLSIVAVEAIGQYTQFGPLVGQRIEEADIHEDMDLKNIWEIFGTDYKLYVDTADENTSNWLRYTRPASSKCERNVSVIAREDNLYFVTIKDVDPGTELLYWAEDPTISWSKKKMEKTSCGGCNQRFRHPLYYRMHCMIFHDPNYSLTIRKYHCKICGIAVLGKENIMRHASEMHEGKGAYQCQYCKKFFLRLNYLDMHRTYGCKLNPRRSRPLCDLCGKKFCQPQKLKVHIRRMHSDISEVLKEFQCKSCFKLLGSRAALQRHLKEVHNKDQNIAATCDRCGKTFQNKSNLKIHMLTHSGVKPFRCTENSCMAAFTTKQCLQFHYKKVHGYTLDSMPAIERCIAYTFESYSGGASDNEGNGVSEIHSRFDDPKSVASVVTATNTDLDSSSMCSSSMTDFPVVKESVNTTAIVGDLLERRVLDNVDASTISVDQHGWMEERNEACEREPSPISNDPEPLVRMQSNESEQQERVIVVNDMNEAHNDVIDEVDMRRNEAERSPERTMVAEIAEHSHLESRMDSIVKSEQLEGENMEDIPEMRQHFDDEDAEQIDSSDVDLESDMDDNSVSDHSLDLEHQEDDSSDLMVPSPRQQQQQQQPPPICHSQEQLSEVERIHARNIVLYESTGLVRHLIKDSDGSKEYHGDVDFSAVRHYAASMAAAHNDYGLHARQSGNQTANDSGLHHQHNHNMHHEEVTGLVSAEDLRGQLSRYELERGSTPIKTEDEEMDINVGGDHHLGKSVHLRSDDNEDLLVTPDDDDEDDEDVIRQQREDVTAALVLAHQEHEMVHDYVRHPPPMHHSTRDMDRLSMHSLDLSIPRTTAHLLEHLARTTPHVLEHLANRGCGPPPSPPDEQSVDHLPRPSSHGNLHMSQLGGPFHGMEALARPLPHRLDHMGHLQSSHPMDHMSRPPSQPPDMDSHMSPRLDPMSPPLPPHTPLDTMPHSLNYVVDHLARLPSSHGMDGFSRSHMSGGGGGGSSGMDTLIRAGVETLARPSPRPGSHRMDGIGRSFSAYGIEHSVSGGQSSATYLLPPHGSGSDHLSRPPSTYSLEQRSTPHSLDLTMSRGGGGNSGGGGGGMDSPSQSHDGGGGRTMSPPSYQECSPPTASSSSSSFQASAMTSSASQLPPLTPSPVPTSIHSAYPTYLEYY